MNPQHLKLLHRLFIVLISILAVATIGFIIYVIAHQQPTIEQAPEPLPQLQEPAREVVFEGNTEYGYEVCYDSGVCVVDNAPAEGE